MIRKPDLVKIELTIERKTLIRCYDSESVVIAEEYELLLFITGKHVDKERSTLARSKIFCVEGGEKDISTIGGKKYWTGTN